LSNKVFLQQSKETKPEMENVKPDYSVYGSRVGDT